MIPFLAAVALALMGAHAPVWNDLAACESSGVWDTNTGNGFYGGLQIWQPTWAEHGGLDYAPRADLATQDDQITVAEEILREQGWSAWPDCSRRLGLSGRWHTAQPGDTLQSVADRFQVPEEELRQLNPGAEGADAGAPLVPGTLIRLP
jgi:hypothetical protein